MDNLKNLLDQIKGLTPEDAVEGHPTNLDPNLTLPQIKDQTDAPLFVQRKDLQEAEIGANGENIFKDIPAQVSPATQQAKPASNIEPGQVSQEASNKSKGNEVPEAPLTDQERLLKQFQELSNKHTSTAEEVEKRNMYAKMVGALGEGLSRYQTAGLQKNVLRPIDYQGVTQKSIEPFINENPQSLKSLAEQKALILAKYNELNKKAIQDARDDKRIEAQDKRFEKSFGLSQDRAELAKEKAGQLDSKQIETLDNQLVAKNEAKRLLPILNKARDSIGIVGTPVSELEKKFGKNPEYQELTQNYEAIKSKIRHALYGGMLSAHEAANFEKEMSGIGISDKAFEQNLNNFISRIDRSIAQKLESIKAGQPLKTDTVNNYKKLLGVEEKEDKSSNKPSNQQMEPEVKRGDKVYKWNATAGKYQLKV